MEGSAFILQDYEPDPITKSEPFVGQGFGFMMHRTSGRSTSGYVQEVDNGDDSGGAYGSMTVEDTQETAVRALEGIMPGQRAYLVKQDEDAQQRYREDVERAREEAGRAKKKRQTEQEEAAARRARDKEEAIEELCQQIRDEATWIDPENSDACLRFIDMADMSDINEEEAREIITRTWREHMARAVY